MLDNSSLLLLRYLADLPASLMQILSEEADLLFNQPKLILGQEQIRERVLLLISMGFIVAEPLFKPVELSEWSAQLFLTEKGADELAKVLELDWSNFLSVDVELNGDGLAFVTMEAESLEKIESTVTDLPLKSIEFETLSPWQATYWKRLDLGFRATFSVPEKIDEDNNKLCSSSCWKKRFELTDGNLGIGA